LRSVIDCSRFSERWHSDGTEVLSKIKDGRSGVTASVGEFEDQFKAVAETKRAVVVDLSETNYLSSLGVRLLMSGARAVHNKGGKLVLLSPKENVRAVLGIVGIEQIIPIVFDRSAAAAIKKD
jgi:anti-sigma B factor antagonist